MKKIYIVGEAKGAYRTQAFVKMLLDHPDQFRVKYNSWSYSRRITRALRSLFINPFSILFSDVVYVPALNVGVDILYEVLLARLFNKEVIIEYYVSVYDTVVLDRKMFSPSSMMAKLAMTYDQLLVKAADKVIFLNACEYNRYAEISKLSIDADKVRIIPLCIERRGKLTPVKQNPPGPFSMCWWGSYLPLHGLEKIIDSVKLLIDSGEDVRLYIFGNNPQKAEKYMKTVNGYGLNDQIVFNDEYSFSNGLLEPFLLSNCQLAFGLFGESDKAKNVIPNKILDAVAMKCPIITGPSNALPDYFDGINDLFYCDSTPEAIVAEVKKIITMDQFNLETRTEIAYEIFDEHFTIEKYREKMMQLLTEE